MGEEMLDTRVECDGGWELLPAELLQEILSVLATLVADAEKLCKEPGGAPAAHLGGIGWGGREARAAVRAVCSKWRDGQGFILSVYGTKYGACLT